mgnify:CR=1 FL=1
MMETSLELFCEYRLKLYHLKTLEMSNGRNLVLSFIESGLWVITANEDPHLNIKLRLPKIL